jgi:hypothetical protein
MIFLSGIDDITGTPIPPGVPARIDSPTNPTIGQPPSNVIPKGTPAKIGRGPSERIPFGPGGDSDARDGLPFSRTIRPRDIAGPTAVLPAFPVPGAGEEAKTLRPTNPVPGPTGRIQTLRQADQQNNAEFLLSAVRARIAPLIKLLAMLPPQDRKAVLAGAFDLLDVPDATAALNRLTLEFIAKGTQASVAFREALSRVMATNFAVVIPMQAAAEGAGLKSKTEEKFDTKYAPSVNKLSAVIVLALKLIRRMFNEIARLPQGVTAINAISAKYGIDGLSGLGNCGACGRCSTCAMGLWEPRHAGLTMPEPVINHGYFTGTSGLGLWEPRLAGRTMPEPTVNRAYIAGVVYDAARDDYPRLKNPSFIKPGVSGLGIFGIGEKKERKSPVPLSDVPRMQFAAGRPGLQLVDVLAFLQYMDVTRTDATREGTVRYSALVRYTDAGKVYENIKEIKVPISLAEKYRPMGIMPGLPSSAELQGQTARIQAIPEAQIKEEKAKMERQALESKRQDELDRGWQQEFDERNSLSNLLAREAADTAKGVTKFGWQFIKEILKKVPTGVWLAGGAALAGYIYVMYFYKPGSARAVESAPEPTPVEPVEAAT